MTTVGPRQQIMRTVACRPGLFLIALRDKHRTHLGLVRFDLMQVESGLP